jgi:hypothetical protein
VIAVSAVDAIAAETFGRAGAVAAERIQRLSDVRATPGAQAADLPNWYGRAGGPWRRGCQRPENGVALRQPVARSRSGRHAMPAAGCASRWERVRPTHRRDRPPNRICPVTTSSFPQSACDLEAGARRRRANQGRECRCACSTRTHWIVSGNSCIPAWSSRCSRPLRVTRARC